MGVLGTAGVGEAGPTRLFAAFVHRLRELGYVEGQNLIVERRLGPEGRADQLRELAGELVRLNVEVIVATGTLTPHAAKSATTTIPVVITNHGDPVGTGLVVSLARPGGNITGPSLLGPEVVPKQLELLKAAAPRIVGMAVLLNPNNQTHGRMLNEAGAAAHALGLQLRRLYVEAGGLMGYGASLVDNFPETF